MDYKIVRMQHAERGYQIATVISFFDQQEYQLHNRWGSWFIGDPEDKGGREPATISKDLPFDLQAYLHYKNGVNVLPKPLTGNVFAQRAVAKKRENVFVKKPKVNPFIAKAQKV